MRQVSPEVEALGAEKVSQDSVDYREATIPGRRCGTCTMYSAGTCDLVAGEIKPDHVCDRWQAKGTRSTPLARLKRWGDSWQTQDRAPNGQFGSGSGVKIDSTLEGGASGSHETTPIRASDISQAGQGLSRPVSEAEFHSLAGEGKQILAGLDHPTPMTGLNANWDQVKANAYQEVQKSWGGQTIDAHTGEPLNAEKGYALTVRPPGMGQVTVPEHASEADFNKAMDAAKQEYGSELEKGNRYLGVFHDDTEGRIDIDPVLVVNSVHEVEAVGSYTHAVGGAYDFSTGNGIWPPHVADAAPSDNVIEGGGSTPKNSGAFLDGVAA